MQHAPYNESKPDLRLRQKLSLSFDAILVLECAIQSRRFSFAVVDQERHDLSEVRRQLVDARDVQ
jgi:hypothetical protein